VETLTLKAELKNFPTNNILAKRAVKGDLEAFEQLYRETVGRIYAVCLRMTGDPSYAEDLTQETYVQAWRNLKNFRSDSAFETWLYQIAVNTVIGDVRKVARRELRELRSQQAASSVTEAPAVHAHTRMDLETAMQALPEGARVVFVLHDVQGHKHPEIAKKLNIAEGTSKAQLHRARRILRERLSS
jgi:RNA polymerase sigma-70 factor (ECF subfamily)